MSMPPPSQSKGEHLAEFPYQKRMSPLLIALQHGEGESLETTRTHWQVRDEELLAERVFEGLQEPRDPRGVRETLKHLTEALPRFPPMGPSYEGMVREIEDIQRRLAQLGALMRQEDLRPNYLGPWNLGTTGQGRLILVEGDSEVLVTLILAGKPLRVRLLGLGLEDRPSAVRVTSCRPMESEWVYPRLEWGLREGRVMRLEPNPPKPPKLTRSSQT